MRAIKVQLSPTPAQRRLLNAQLEEHRILYNHCLEQRIRAWKERSESIPAFTQIKNEIAALRQATKLPLSNYSSLQQTVRRLDKTYKNFFRGGGFPRFKKEYSTIEYAKRGDGCGIKKGKLRLQNVGNIRCRWHCDIPEFKTLSVTRRGDKYYVNFIVVDEPVAPVGAEKLIERKAVGLDFGLKTFLTTSTGEKIESPKFHKLSLREQAKVQRRIERVKNAKSVKERAALKRYRRTLRKVHQKIANRRSDFNHKLSRKLVNSHDVIVLENINLRGLVSEIAPINRSYADVAFGQFKTFLTYKAENAGKTVILVNPAYTTQTCSNCGALVPKSIKERIHRCACGCELDRDHNAAKNILELGLTQLNERRARRSEDGAQAPSARGPRIHSGE